MNAARAAELGVPCVISPLASIGELAEVMETVLDDTTMRSNARHL